MAPPCLQLLPGKDQDHKIYKIYQKLAEGKAEKGRPQGAAPQGWTEAGESQARERKAQQSSL